MSRSYYRTRIKFCGMTRAGDVRLAGELGVSVVRSGSEPRLLDERAGCFALLFGV